MIATIDGNEVKLYGTIWWGDGNFIVSQLSKLLSKKQDVTIRLHTPGGSVFDGNLIFNAIASAKANVTIIIDGLAASMGSIIMLAGSKILMAENAFVMIHAPSGDARGNAKDFENSAKLLRSMESNFIKKLTTKTQQDQSVVSDWMNGDNWFSAEEAKDLGLIDEVIEPVLRESSLSDYQDLKMCASLFAAYDTKEGVTPPIPNINPKNENEMKLSAESLKALGLQEGATEAEINAAITAANQRTSDLEKRIAQEQEAKCTALVDRAIAEGRILGGEKEQWLTDARANYTMTERVLAKLPAKKSLPVDTTSEAITDSDDKNPTWSFNDWRKKDPKGLLEMKSQNPERYAALLSAK